MLTDCPHCGKRIRWRHYLGGRPARGDRRFLPSRAITVCPFCRADIAVNVHPLERRLTSFLFLPVFLVLIVLVAVPRSPVPWLMLVGIVVALTLLAQGVVHARTKHWQRFRRYEGTD